ncbi:MAG: hypothetical protein AB7D92_01040 [Sphaerochaeta sp.]
MKRIHCLVWIALASLMLTSCTTTRKAEALPLSVTAIPSEHFLRLSLTRNDLRSAGYTLGDTLTIEIEGILIHARYSQAPQEGYTTLIAKESDSLLYLPKEVAEGSKGILFPFQDGSSKFNTKLNVTGNFVFTL